MTLRRWSFLAVVAAGTIAAARSAAAQTLTTGEVSGSVSDATGAPLGDAVVTLRAAWGGVARGVGTTRDGEFHLSLVLPGEYRLLVEHLGYRPVLLLGVSVRPGATAAVDVRLHAAPPPVTRIDTVRATLGVTANAGAGEWYPVGDLRWLPDRSGGAGDIGRLSSRVTPELAAEGLPSLLSGFVLDGQWYRPARNPGLPGGQLDSPIVRLSDLDGAELVTNGADAEWGGLGGATLAALGRQGTPDFEAHFSADGSGAALASSDYFNTGAISSSRLRSALFLTGPIIGDSAQFVFGVEGERLREPMPAPLIANAPADSLLTIAQDSFHVGLNSYLQPRVDSTDALAAFGGLYWRISGTSDVTVSARYATATTRNVNFASDAGGLGSDLDSRDFLGQIALRSTLSSTISQEFRLGITTSARGFAGTIPVATTFVDLGNSVGSASALPGQFRRTTAQVSEAVYDDLGQHRLKFGAALSLNSYDQAVGANGPGAFVFGGPAGFAQGSGAYTAVRYATPEVQFSVPELGVYAQDVISAAAGLDLLLGFRYDGEALPRSDVVANQGWRQASGLDNTAFTSGLQKLSPRVAFNWDVGERRTTLVRGAAGVYFDEIDPGILGETIRESLGDTVRVGVGALAAWPAPPDGQHAPAAGTDLMLLQPSPQAPRTGRLDASLVQQLSGGLTVSLAGAYRHTDFLPRRTNLNLPSAPTGSDQYGRPIFGTLVQEGQFVTVQPGSNDRFAGFDVVSAIDPDGYSDYWGLTVTLERQVGAGLRLLGSYTYSKTTDNLLAATSGPGGALSPFPDSLSGQDWAGGRSDFDVPGRLVLAAELKTHLPLAPRISVRYRRESGAPFTPGFRGGVDPSGTGSGADPAYVDGSLSGMSPLLAQWDCLRSQVGQFATRNSCRDPDVQSLDLRIAFDLLRVGRTPFTLVIDGLNLLESDVALRDHALVLVDPTKSLTVNAMGRVNVPLVANPGFGSVLIHESPGRELRIGFRVNY